MFPAAGAGVGAGVPSLLTHTSLQCVVIGLQSTGECTDREVLGEKEGQLDGFVSAVSDNFRALSLCDQPWGRLWSLALPVTPAEGADPDPQRP